MFPTNYAILSPYQVLRWPCHDFGEVDRNLPFSAMQGNFSMSAVEGISSNLFAAPDTWSWAIESTRKAKVMRNSRHVPFSAFQMTKPT
jgi:hypothetical protein